MDGIHSKKPPNVVWYGGKVHPEDRSRLLGQCPATIWLTGLSASGKSTLAFALERDLIDLGHACYVLDGDNIRHGLNKDLGFSHQARTENIRRVAEVAHLMNDAGLVVITAFISPYRNDREVARQIIGADHFIEIYVNTPIEACEARDPKNMYKQARAGEIREFTGVSAPYEPPGSPHITVDTSIEDPAECTRKVLCGIINDIGISASGKQPNFGLSDGR